MKNQIPVQHTGESMDSVAKAEFQTVENATEFYQTAKKRLLNTYQWAEICKIPLSVFV